MIIRKLLKSRWLSLSLLVGLTTAVALVSSIPMYTDGVLQRLLRKDLEDFQVTTGGYPGGYLIEKTYRHFSSGEFHPTAYPADDWLVTKQLSPRIPLTPLIVTLRRNVTFLTALPFSRRDDTTSAQQVNIETRSGIEDHAAMIHGRMYSNERKDGEIEAIVSEAAMRNLGLVLDDLYVVNGPEQTSASDLLVRIVGVFGIKDEQDLFWHKSMATTGKSFIIAGGIFDEIFKDPDAVPDTEVEWYYAFDYREITVRNYRNLLSVLKDTSRALIKARIVYEIPVVPILEKYIEREKNLRLTLAFLEIPVLIMLAVFLYVVSLVIIEKESNEIAVLKSRGASSFQVFLIYLIGNLILSAIALVVGPPIGFLICRFLGSTNGFLEFIRRSSLPVTLSLNVYLYALASVVVFLAAILFPAVKSSRTTIVLHKQRVSRKTAVPVWQRYFLDLVLLGISIYGLYRYRAHQTMLRVTGAEAGTLPIDPLLFVVSTLFILGCALLFLRIFPLLIRVIFWAGRKVWPVELYASFIHVGRSTGYERFVIIFLVLTIALGVFNSSAARTINRNVEDKIHYATGADLVLVPTAAQADVGPEIVDVASLMPPESPYGDPSAADLSSSLPSAPPTTATPKEESFDAYLNLIGVDKATKVLRKEGVTIRTEDSRSFKATLLAVIPNEFAKVAWFRSDLLPFHWYSYLNVLASAPDAMLVSRSAAQKFEIAPGDPLSITWTEQKPIEGTYAADIVYWPTFNPNTTVGTKTTDNYLVVANYAYVRAKMFTLSYEVWIDRADNVPSSALYRDIEEKGLAVGQLKDATLDIITQKNNPVLQSTNGILTLGFLVTLGVSLIGFLICSMLSVQGRTLQFGILRAMGLSRRKVIWIVLWEQLLISATAVLIGTLAGGLTGQLYVPFLQMVASSATQVPPFVVGALQQDYVNLFVFVMLLFVGVLVVFSLFISRLKISQALKLGEE